jgi:hypothetical protein
VGEHAQIILGDDLGVSQFAYFCARLDYLNIPYVNKIGARIFSTAEVVYYPTEPEKSIRENCRLSLGFGVNLPVNSMVALSLFHNFANFGGKPGDVHRNSFVNFTLQFF